MSFDIIKKIIIFILSILIVSTSMYYYIYVWFIVVNENNEKVIYNEKIIIKTINEKKYNLNLLLYKQLSKGKHNISQIIIDFIENKKSINYNFYFTLKKEWITQVNNIFNTNLFIENTNNNINISLKPTVDDKQELIIKWYINSTKFSIIWIYDKDENTLLLTHLYLDWLLTLINYDGYNSYLEDWFNIRYTELIWKKIQLDVVFKKMFDYAIPESKRYDIEAIINWIEMFVNLPSDKKEVYFKFSNKEKWTETKIRNYIITQSNLTIWQKQRALIDILQLTNQLENSELIINRDKIHLKNKDSLFFFNYDLRIDKIDKRDYKEIDKNLIEEDFTYTLHEINEIFLTKNKLLVKYLNWEDLLFLVP